MKHRLLSSTIDSSVECSGLTLNGQKVLTGQVLFLITMREVEQAYLLPECSLNVLQISETRTVSEVNRAKGEFNADGLLSSNMVLPELASSPNSHMQLEATYLSQDLIIPLCFHVGPRLDLSIVSQRDRTI